MENGAWQAKAVWPLVALVAVVGFSCKHQSQTATAPAPSPTPPNLTLLAAPSPIIGKPYPATGVVKLISRKEGWIEIDHEEIVGFMPAMEMEWSVQKKSLLDDIKVGDKVNFTVVETGKGEIITELKKAAAEK